MRIADIPVNTLDGIDQICENWPNTTAWCASINAMAFVMAVGHENEWLASASIGLLFVFLWVACLVGRPKK